MYVRADLTNAYQNPAFQSTKPDGSRNRPKVSHVGREVVYLRGEGQRDAFVVFDRVVSTDASFKKAVLWHAREPFESKAKSASVDEGETRYEGGVQYDFQSLVAFKEGSHDARARLFVSAIVVDPITVRAIGKRVPTENADHTTFDVQHHHRHVKDYYVQDPRDLTNPDRNTGHSAGRSGRRSTHPNSSGSGPTTSWEGGARRGCRWSPPARGRLTAFSRSWCPATRARTRRPSTPPAPRLDKRRVPSCARALATMSSSSARTRTEPS